MQHWGELVVLDRRFQQAARAVNVPTMVNLVEGGKTPLLSVKELEDMGFKVISFSGSAQKMAMKAMQDFFSTLKAEQKLDNLLDRISGLNDRSELLGLPRYYEMESKYRFD